MTYRQIKLILDGMSKEQLDQPAQIFPHQYDADKTIPLKPIIGFRTIKYLVSPENLEENLEKEQQKTRSSFDNKHHSDHFVFLIDNNMFAEDGTIGFNLFTGKRI